MYQDPDLWSWLELFLPLKGTTSETTHSPVTFILKLNILKGTSQAPAVNTLRSAVTTFLTSKRYDEHPRSF